MVEKIGISNDDLKKIDDIRSACEEFYDDDAESIITGERYERLEVLGSRILKKAAPKLSTTDKIDNIVTSRILGIPIFALVMFLVYSLAVYEHSPGTMATEAVNGFFDDTLIPGAQAALESASINEVLVGLVTDGILAGVGAVLGFLPQMMVMFALLSILEDIGYMLSLIHI